MWATHVGLGAGRQVHQNVSELPHINNGQCERVVGESRKRLFAHPRYPQKDKFSRLNIDLAIEREDADILANPFVFHQNDGAEVHIDVVANM